MLKTVLGRVRVIGFLEGLSFLLLLFIAMPLKYYADLPVGVQVIGPLHGVLFVLYLFVVAHATFALRWSFIRAIGAVLASVIPFGTFVLDARLKKDA
ncbi:DUF3817 domain-containing protein [Brevibacillus laterosporus]|uniref:DUF3817 domain-containing protein n=1 Tax=Brevibacillus laterosporus TaxID=1465 RepID=A0AAP3DDL6_BRELA|nr:DUF3817 domain-containing protein [Brevibacillus laterosporus]ATO48816.1 hypothetical protein BrL25_06680 [Brevibacillus laterosporus DSM 25]AYB41150.1 DUF3817 domain-containing protein [Brevibacillus laterosporus]MBG9773840.1 membrane protein [Brevibacillus laterosporus]MBG9786691.1 membrane protein [Brevibacillus laterosporus]MBG9797683.1 membrane protein [Brevibacillus laterosporus]